MYKRWLPLFTVGWIFALIVVNILMIPSPGTIDTRNWEAVLFDIMNRGNQFVPDCLNYLCPSNYVLTKFPPAHFLLFYLFSFVFPPTVFGTLLATKSIIFVFYLLTMGTVVWFAKSVLHVKISTIGVLAIFLSLFSLILNAQGLAYTDVLTFPFVILSIGYLMKKRHFIAGVFFMVSMLLKWQPIILLPICLVFILKKKRLVTGASRLGMFIVGMILVVAVLHLVNPQLMGSMILSFRNAVAHQSSIALNVPWLVRQVIMASADGPFNPLLLPFRVMFIVSYILILVRYVRLDDGKNGRHVNFLLTALIALATYFMLSIGAHENHFILGTLIAFLLYLVHPGVQTRRTFIIVDAVNIVNMFLSYGLLGTPVVPRIIVGVDLWILSATGFSLLFLWCFSRFIVDYRSLV